MAAAKPGAGFAKVIEIVQMFYAALPPGMRLMFAQSVSEWADAAKRKALSDMGAPPDPEPGGPATYTTHGHTRP